MTATKPKPTSGESEKSRAVLELAALFNKDFSIDWLIQISSEKPSTVLETLEQGVQQGLLSKIDFSRFCFRNLRFRAGLQKALTPQRRKALEHAIADLLLKELPDDETKAAQVAGYLLRTENDLKQCRWLLKAGDLYLKSFKTEEGLQCFEKVLKDLTTLTGREADELFMETVIKYSRIADVRFDIRRMLDLLQNALNKAEQYGDQRAAALLYMHMAKNHWYRSDYQQALTCFRKGWALSETENDPKLKRSALTFSAFFHYWQGYFQEAVTLYEAEISGMEDMFQGHFQLMAEATIGNCYTMVGQAAQGFGMIHAVRDKCLQTGNTFMLAFSALVSAIALIDIQRFEEAGEQVRQAAVEGGKWPKSPLRLFCHLLSAYVDYQCHKEKQAVRQLQAFLNLRSQLQVSMWPYPYLLELCFEVEQGRLPRIKGLVFHNEIQQALKSKNVFLAGIAHRYRALQLQQEEASDEVILHSLTTSEKYLGLSGHLIELLRTRVALYHHYLRVGNEKAADQLLLAASTQLSRLPESMLPADLRILHQEQPDVRQWWEQLAHVSAKLMDIPDHDERLLQLLHTANRTIGAERGAVFLLKSSGQTTDFALLAARHLTAEQTVEGDFTYARQVVQEVLSTGQSRRLSRPEMPSQDSHQAIRSLICVPLRFKGAVQGALYHDNRMLTHAFQDLHVTQLHFFAALTALTVQNRLMEQELGSITRGDLALDPGHPGRESLYGIVGQSPAIQRVFLQVAQVAPTEANVLILGETGSGKELVAHAIHAAGPRGHGPFISVNCNALPDSLISSELFGHEKGAFTGAFQRRIGRFELAHGGTLFLDEIGELPLETQVKLLRVLQTHEFERIGGGKTLHSDFRLITATHRNLEAEIQAGRFRADLYYRLNSFPLYVPPLRERKADISLLARHFLQIYAQNNGKRFQSFPEKELEKLLQYDWPGNVRELANVIERGVILSQGGLFKVPDKAWGVSTTYSGSHASGPQTILEDVERQHILHILAQTNWKIRGRQGAAVLLGLHPSTLYSRMKKLGIRRETDPGHVFKGKHGIFVQSSNQRA